MSILDDVPSGWSRLECALCSCYNKTTTITISTTTIMSKLPQSAFTTMVGNPYDSFEPGDVICVTTNAEVKINGNAVMGRGCAEFVRDNFKGSDKKLGVYLKQYGNRVFRLGEHTYAGRPFQLVTFPTKNQWRDRSDLGLIRKSAQELRSLCDKFGYSRIYIPIPGCTNGYLRWSQVKEELRDLDSRFVVYSLNGRDFQR